MGRHIDMEYGQTKDGDYTYACRNPQCGRLFFVKAGEDPDKANCPHCEGWMGMEDFLGKYGIRIIIWVAVFAAIIGGFFYWPEV